MPYLKIRTAYGTDNDWTTINNLTLEDLTTNSITASGEIKASSFIITEETKEIPLKTYIEENGSKATVWDNTNTNLTSPPATYDDQKKKSGNFLIEKRKVGSTTYNLLWYTDGIQWIQMNAIWG